MIASFLAGVEYHNKIYYAENWINAFCSFDLSTHEIEVIGVFDQEELCGGLFRDAAIYKDNAWFIPATATHIVCVDLNTFEMKYFDVPYRRKNWEDDKVYHTTYSRTLLVKDRYLYCQPLDIDTLLKIDLEEEKLYPIYDIQPCEDLEKRLSAIAEWRDELLLFYNDDIKCRRMSLSNGDLFVGEYLLQKPGLYTSPICADDNLYCLFNKSNEVSVFESDFGEKDVYIPAANGRYTDGFCIGGKVLYFPFNARSFLLLNIDQKSLDTVDFNNIENAEYIYTDEDNKMNNIRSSDGRILISTSFTGCVMEFTDIRHPVIYRMEFDSAAFLRKYAKKCKEAGINLLRNGLIRETYMRTDSLRGIHIGEDLQSWLALI